ncbi:TPA: methionine sulfoxide reductase [candidate division WOR-3 bacterium]|uniref:Peptide methionine sulfoxide reductase MsrA n=1 Tax=candidate division WOR-3 bacterium TaxID=2052148 RepID=A0A350H7T8_UNCW3|nr:methionine sulfoxide reductase [candidate division WOR-3 bacterium]
MLIFITLLLMTLSCKEAKDMTNNDKDYRNLTSEEKRVIVNKGTEMPFTGEYNNFYEEGAYNCKRCGAPLYISTAKFKSTCGWPSFDEEIKGAVKRIPDADGMRIEIQCANCKAHLGHVFEGEGYTDKNVRHCVNSISLVFVPKNNALAKKAYFAGGCFWGVEYFFEKREGVISAVSGYMGGEKDSPTYKDVCTGASGHYETVEVTYDANKTSFEELAKFFFEIHDFEQKNGQGPDIGEQYKSVVFYRDEEEKRTAERLIGILKEKGYDVATKVLQSEKFYIAEDYHQDYYEHKGSKPYCHIHMKKF